MSGRVAMARGLLAAAVLLAGCDKPSGDPAPAPPPTTPAPITPEPTPRPASVEAAAATGDGQNYTVAATGALRIEGDPTSRYDINLPTDVLFDFDQSTLRSDAAPLLAQLKAHFAGRRTNQVHVRGHTDAKGSDQHNYVLSMKRAKAVCDWLKRETAVGATMCIGRGETEPLRPETNADGSDNPLHRQLNRRVTVSVVVYPDVKAMLDRAKAQAAGATTR